MDSNDHGNKGGNQGSSGNGENETPSNVYHLPFKGKKTEIPEIGNSENQILKKLSEFSANKKYQSGRILKLQDKNVDSKNLHLEAMIGQIPVYKITALEDGKNQPEKSRQNDAELSVLSENLGTLQNLQARLRFMLTELEALVFKSE